MTLIAKPSSKARGRKTRPDILPNAYVFYDDCDLSLATYFELRPISDGHYICSTYLYGDDTNQIQIRTGSADRPSELVAK